jgi:multiple sugar transport system substrate-binding protein
MATLRVAVRKFDPFKAALEKQFAAFLAATGTDASLEAVELDLNPLHDTLLGEGGLTDGSWDIAFLPTDWLAESVQKGLIRDLAPLHAADPLPDYPDGWSASLTGMQRMQGGFFGVPYHDGPQCLIYRRDLFDNAEEQDRFQQATGKPLAVPQTWSDFHECARFFHRPEQDLSGTVLAAYPDGHNGVYDFCIQMWTRGGEPFDADGNLTIDTPEAEAALDFHRALAVDASACHPGAQEIDSVKSGLLFCDGKIAMMANWFGFAALGETMADSPVKAKVDIAPLPAGDGPKGRSVSLNVYWMLTLAAGSRNKDLAWAFMRHAASPEMDRITTQEGAIGCRRSTWTDPAVNREVPFYHKLDELHEHARELPRDTRLPSYAAILDRMLARGIKTDTPSTTLIAEAMAEAEAL